jgi:hypothetical protein
MANWTRVKWSEALQVLEVLGPAREPAEAADALPPQAYFEHLRHTGRRPAAARFLGQALPRLEAVAWAARAVRDLSPQTADRGSPEARALRAALLWVSDPTETRRRAAFEVANQARSGSPEHLAAMAVFFSGGSIAPENVHALMPSRDAAGRFAAVAVITAAARTGAPNAAMDHALDLGVGIASQGLEAQPA